MYVAWFPCPVWMWWWVGCGCGWPVWQCGSVGIACGKLREWSDWQLWGWSPPSQGWILPFSTDIFKLSCNLADSTSWYYIIYAPAPSWSTQQQHLWPTYNLYSYSHIRHQALVRSLHQNNIIANTVNGGLLGILWKPGSEFATKESYKPTQRLTCLNTKPGRHQA